MKPYFTSDEIARLVDQSKRQHEAIKNGFNAHEDIGGYLIPPEIATEIVKEEHWKTTVEVEKYWMKGKP